VIQFSIAVSALQTAEQGLAIAGNNIANASTPGYHVESAVIGSLGTTQLGNLAVGMGSGITTVNRAVSSQLDAALTQQTIQNGYTDASLTASTQIENVLSTGTTSPATQLESLLNSLQSLSSSPTNGASLNAAVNSASTVATAFNNAANDLSQIQQGLDTSVNSDVSQINSLTSQLAKLNDQISSLPNTQNGSVNSLLDQQSALVSQLSGLVNIQVQNGNNNQVSIVLGNTALVAGTESQPLNVGSDSSGNLTITAAGSTSTLPVTGGDLGGLLSQRNQTLSDYQNRLDTLAKQVATSFNAVQSTGLGSAGGFSQITGQNGVTNTTANLNAAGLASAPTSGTLYVGVTNTATGQRTITAVPITPQTQSLQDAASAISSDVPNLQSYVNNQTGTLSIIASPGYTFDFTGGYESSPTTNFSSGSTTTPTVSGTYTGTKNDNYTVTFLSSGTIGVTPNLQAQVTDSSGNVLTTLNVGQGYQAGQSISVANGITLSLNSGTAAAGDSFSTPVVASADSGGILNSLGINTLFTGNSAATLSVSSSILNNPSLLATSTTGQAGDTSNLQRFAALGTATVLNNSSQTFSQYANQMVSDIGTEVQTLTAQQSTNQTLTTSITNQQQSVEGVDTNQELSNVMQYQQMFEVAGKYMSAINDAVQSLISAVSN